MTPYLTEDHIVEDHFPEVDFEAQPGLKYPEYEAQTGDYSETDVIKQGGSYTRLAVGKKLLFWIYLNINGPTTALMIL